MGPSSPRFRYPRSHTGTLTGSRELSLSQIPVCRCLPKHETGVGPEFRFVNSGKIRNPRAETTRTRIRVSRTTLLGNSAALQTGAPACPYSYES